MSNNAVFQQVLEFPFDYQNPTHIVYQSVIETARPADQFLSVSGALGNNRIDGHVISLKRFASLCNPPQRGSLLLDTSFPRENINPGERIVLFEKGVRVLTGYVTKITRERPSYNWLIDFEDEYTRVTNTFLSDELFFETATSMKYLIQQVLEPTGIRYRISGPDWAVAPGARLGLRSAHDALTEILAYGSLYAWCDPDGTLRLRAAASRKFQQNVKNPIGTSRAVSTEQTRNDVHVYGGILENGVLVNVASFKEVDGLVVDLKTVVANPLLTTYTDAQRISDFLLRELGSLTDILTFETVGNPYLRIGTSGSLYHRDSLGFETSGSGPITSIETTIDNKGYVMNVTINERCPRIAGWTQPPNQMRALWIAARGGGTDPRPEKLIWTGDFGLGGMPTYNIVKTIPSGMITAMHVTRNGERVYLLMMRETDTGQINELWYSDNPYYNDVQWNLALKTGTSGGVPGAGGLVDEVIFGVSAITSMQIIGNDLHLVARFKDSSVFPFEWNQVYGVMSNGSSSPVFLGVCGKSSPGYHGFIPSGVATKGMVFKAMDNLSTSIRGYSFPFYVLRGGCAAAAEFNTTLNNGVSIVAPNRATGNMWRADNDEKNVIFAGFLNNDIFNVGSSVYTDTGNLPHEHVHIRGDYWGGQYQFVDFLGRLFVGQGAGSPSQIFQWYSPGFNGCGVVVCIDKLDPKRLAWIPLETDVANEVARYSQDGGVTWTNQTGNWWGSNGEVTNGSRMQSQGDFLMIDAHPTFWNSEIIPDDGA